MEVKRRGGYIFIFCSSRVVQCWERFCIWTKTELVPRCDDKMGLWLEVWKGVRKRWEGVRESDGNWRCRRELFLSLFSTTDCVSSIRSVDSSNLTKEKNRQKSRSFFFEWTFFPASAPLCERYFIEWSLKNSARWIYTYLTRSVKYTFRRRTTFIYFWNHKTEWSKIFVCFKELSYKSEHSFQTFFHTCSYIHIWLETGLDLLWN